MRMRKFLFKSFEGISLFGQKATTFKNSPWLTMDEKCPLCTGEFEENDAVELLTNNGKAFPNCTIHQRCVETYASDGCYETIFCELRDSYKRYQNNMDRKRWEHWQK